MNGKQASKELIDKEVKAGNSLQRLDSTTESDAVHPRFQTSSPEAIEKFQIANDYYCEQCKLFFAPTVLGLNTHFKEDMVKHKPIDFCLYCDGPVYAYSFNKEQQIYHNCMKHS